MLLKGVRFLEAGIFFVARQKGHGVGQGRADRLFGGIKDVFCRMKINILLNQSLTKCERGFVMVVYKQIKIQIYDCEN